MPSRLGGGILPVAKNRLSNSLFPAIPAKSRYPTADAL